MNGIVNIQGKDYLTVAARLKLFCNEHKDYRINTEVISYENGKILMKASILDNSGNVIATGHALEVEGGSYINKTSAIENCETSAVGRALAFLGYIGSEIASAEEIQNALNRQSETKTVEITKKDIEELFKLAEKIEITENQRKFMENIKTKDEYDRARGAIENKIADKAIKNINEQI